MNCRAELSSYLCQRNRGWILSLLAAVCIVYLPFLGSPFVFDDVLFFFLSGNRVEQYTHSLFQLDMRWLPYASLGWTEAIFSKELTYPFHLGNMLLHAANVILLFFLLRKLISAVIPKDENSSAAIWGSWFGALIFACHPVAVYAVGYVIERSIVMATMFSLVMQLAYLRGILTGQKRWLALAVGAYFLAVFSKEHSVMAPALLAAQTLLLRKQVIASKKDLWATWIALFTIALLLIFRFQEGVLGVSYEVMSTPLFEQQGIVESTSTLHILSVLTQAGLFFKYLLLWWMPDPAWMSVDMREYFVSSLLAWQGWLGAVSFVLYGAISVWLLMRRGWMGLAGLALLYPWLQFMVEFSAIRVQEPFVLYRSYLWMPGMMLFFPLLLTKPILSAVEGLPGRRTLFGLGFIVLLLVPLAWNRLWVFADNYRLWNDAALLLRSEQEAGADRIFYNRAEAEMAAQKWEDASEDYKRAMMLSPQLAPIHHKLGMAYMSMGHYQDALAQFDTAISLKPDNANFYYAKALSLKWLHQDYLAILQMEKSCELKNSMACMIVKMNSGNK